MVDPLGYFSFQPVPHDLCNKGRGIYSPVCVMVYLKEHLQLIGKVAHVVTAVGFLSRYLNGPLHMSDVISPVNKGVFTPKKIPLTTILTYLQNFTEAEFQTIGPLPACSVVPPIYKQSKKTYCHISF